jgi:hypothetical protein
LGWDGRYGKVGALKKTTSASRLKFPPLQQGQKWELTESNIQIGMVGKRLVHYKHFKGGLKRAPVSIASIAVLENYLQTNKAILTEAPPAPVVAVAAK